MRLSKILFSLLFVGILLAQQKIFAQVKVFMTATPQEAAKNEYITLKVTVQNGNQIDKIEMPNIIDFNLMGGPSQESSTSVVNGVTNTTFALSYILQPKNAGTFTIASCAATIDGNLYKTAPVKIVVSNKTISNNTPNNNITISPQNIFNEPSQSTSFDENILRNGETAADKIKKNMELRLETNKNTCYVGQPIIASYKLYTRLQSECSINKNPSFSGFSVLDIKKENLDDYYTQEKLNGKLYNVYGIRKAQLYPLQSGDIEIETAVLDNVINFRNIDYTNNFTEKVSLSSKPISIHVLPLPEKNKPENFNGAVGDFSIEANVEKNNFSTDENGKLLVTITGSGNMQMLTEPSINWPANTDFFESKVIDNTNISTVPVSGSKTFEILFTVNESGNYIIPAIAFSFFNPYNQSYKTIYSKPQTLVITKGTGIKKNISANKNKPVEQMIDNKLLSRKILLGLFIIALLIIGFLFYNGKKNRKNKLQTENKVETTHVLEEIQLPTYNSNKNYFAKSCQIENLENYPLFYADLQEEFIIFLKEKYNLEDKQYNNNTLLQALANKNMETNLLANLKNLLKTIEAKKYAPFEDEQDKIDLFKHVQAFASSQI
jgi:hypothetical protein